MNLLHHLLKTALVIFAVALLSVVLISFQSSPFNDIWQHLGITREKGTKNIEESFKNGYLHYFGAKNLKSIVTGDRKAITLDLLQYSKTQLNSQSFIKQYEDLE
ncbi:MAG: hypothetical protein H0U44_11320 [Flavisolibacter sp.]|jgi:DNA-binding Lrp family transcriptional regulator|nr:hypothetical protein [Flavisolibacter sp.]